MLNYRTAALGGHKQICPDGHITRVWYNSCKHRAYPQCAYGGLLFPNGSLRPWAVIGLFIDYGCMPYLIFASIYLIQEKLRYRDKNRILTPKYASDLIAGEIAIYPKNECIYKWKQRNGQSYGSMAMKVVGFEPDRSISLALDQLSIQLAKNSGKWDLEHEEGWHDSMYSLRGANISEKAAKRWCAGRPDERR